MNKILISRCLMGEKVRYDGNANFCDHPSIRHWQNEGRLVLICPEVAGGLPTPRPAAEIVGQGGGVAVLRGQARVRTRNDDVTDPYVEGALLALTLAKKNHIKVAILKANSPSCGNMVIYDGSFTGAKKTGEGVAAALLMQHGVAVFNEHEIDLVERHLKELDG